MANNNQVESPYFVHSLGSCRLITQAKKVRQRLRLLAHAHLSSTSIFLVVKG